MKRLFRHKLVVVGVVLAAAAGAGGAYAATQSGTDSRQAFINDVAKRLGVTPAQLRAAFQGAFLDRLDAAVKAGQITQAQANKIKQRIEQGGGRGFGPFGAPGLEGPERPVPFVPGGAGGPGGPGGAGGAAPFGFGAPRLAAPALLPDVAGYLGLGPLQLMKDLQSGKSLAQVAQAQGKSVSGLEQVLLKAARSRLDALVSAGVLTKAQEQRHLSRLSARIDRLVTSHPQMFKGLAVPPPGAGSGAAPGPPPGVPVPVPVPPGA